MWGVIGLGNAEPQYQDTRHNVGFDVVYLLAQAHGVRLRRARAAALAGRGEVGEVQVLLGMPLTMMNLSGVAVARLCYLYDLQPQQLMIVVDDINLPLGRLRLRRGGSEGGHRGLRSVTEWLGTKDYPRLRLGIGGPPEGMDARDHVLSPFGKSELAEAQAMVLRARQAIECALTEGLETAMNEFN
jgi:PTH1 family peptidyl-tRNA hydrolase